MARIHTHTHMHSPQHHTTDYERLWLTEHPTRGVLLCTYLILPERKKFFFLHLLTLPLLYHFNFFVFLS